MAKQPTGAVTKTNSPPQTATIPPVLADHQQKLLMKLAVKYGVDEQKMLVTLKDTAFRQRDKKVNNVVVPAPQITNEQMMMLAVVADQYGLNPFTREIYAFPSENGIVAVIGVDGWIRIINERPELEYIDFEIAPPGTEDPYITCIIKRSDRSIPLRVTEFLSECSRNTDPWKEMPRRMLRHKALIQCARIAFGFAGVVDPEEADRIIMTVEKRQEALLTGKASTEPARLTDQPKDPAPPKDTRPRLSMDQCTVIADKLKEEGVGLTHFLASLEINSIEDIAADDYQAALSRIDEISTDAGNGRN